MDNSSPRVCLLGGFSVATEDGVVEESAWRLRKAKALVKLLALAPDRRLHRERLADLLWPDRDADAAANNLHQVLHAARRAIGTDALRLADGVVALEAEIDVDAFEAAAARARETREVAAYERALDLHPGELLPEDRYEPWADGRRAALLELHGGLCVELAELYADDAQAIAALQRALVLDPLAESAHRALMRVYAASGRRQQALAQYQLLRQQLDAELAAEPDPETRSLYRELLAPEPVTDARGNLPHPLTSFVGRERERGEILRLLDRVRLLTLIGPGGCGKTRLAIETLAGVEAVPDGIWFVELAGLTDGSLVAQATALAVGVPIPAQRSAQEALAAHLAAREAIIVLDNCEHVIDACARLAEDLLRAGPGVRVVATSREPLALRRRGGLARPVAGRGEPAVRTSAPPPTPDFSPTERDEATIEEICGRLDGMPLAIELAAARVAALSLDQIAARLGDSLDVLAAGSRTARTRQQTLRATIEWSHDLLTGEERVLFRRLAIFAGGFTLEAAEDVCAGGAIARRQIVDLMARLVDKSLVSGTGRRFRLLDTIGQYAAERLDAAAEHDTVAVRHLDWCLALAEQHDPLSAGPRRSLRTLETEHDNLRSGLTFALRRDPQAALRLATSLWRFWLDRGYFVEGDRWLEATLIAAPERTALRVEALLASAGLSLRSGNSTSYLQRVRAAVTDYRELGDEHATAAALYQHAMLEQSVSNTALRRRPLRRRARHRPPPRRPPPAGGRHPRVGHDPVVPRRPRPGPRGGARGAGDPRGAPRRRDGVLRRGDLRSLPAARRPAGQSAPALRGDDLPLPPLRPPAGHRLCAQQPGLDGARDRRHRAGHRRARRGPRALPRRRGPQRRGADAQPHGQPRPRPGGPRRRPRPRPCGARAAPPARREASDLRQHPGAGDDRDGQRRHRVRARAARRGARAGRGGRRPARHGRPADRVGPGRGAPRRPRERRTPPGCRPGALERPAAAALRGLGADRAVRRARAPR